MIYDLLFMYRMNEDKYIENVLLLMDKLDEKELWEILDFVLINSRIMFLFVGFIVSIFYLKS